MCNTVVTGRTFADVVKPNAYSQKGIVINNILLETIRGMTPQATSVSQGG